MKSVALHDASSNARFNYQDRNVSVLSEEDVDVINKNYNSITRDSNTAENNEFFNLDAKFHARDKKIRSRDSKENKQINLNQ